MSPKMDKLNFEQEKNCGFNYKAFIIYICTYMCVCIYLYQSQTAS